MCVDVLYSHEICLEWDVLSIFLSKIRPLHTQLVYSPNYITVHHFLGISFDEQQSITSHILLYYAKFVNNNLHKICMLYQNNLYRIE